MGKVKGSERVRGWVRGQCRLWVRSKVARELGVGLEVNVGYG